MKHQFLLCLSMVFSILLSAQEVEPDLDLDLVGHYLLDGNDNDATNFQNHCMAFGTYTSDRNGNPNSALQLSEDGHYILFPPIITLSEPEWTYSLWVRPDTLASLVSDMMLLSLSDVQEWQDINLYIDDSGNDFKIWYQKHAWKVSTGVEPEIGKWYHLAICSHANDSVKVYVNGELKLAREIDFISVGEESFILSSIIEYPEDPLKGRFFGAVDDIRIYGKALSEEEVKTIHDPLWDFVPEPVEPEFVTLMTTLIRGSAPLDFFTNTTIERIILYDLRGREVLHSRPMQTERITVIPPALSAGMYVVHAYSPTTIYRGKVMVVN